MPFAGFFSNNPLFAWGLLVLTVLGVIKGKEELDKAQGRRDAERRAEIRARRVQTEIRKRNDERLEKAERTRADFRAGAVSDFGGLSDDAIRRLTRGSDGDSDGTG